MARWHGLWMTPAQPADVEREINIERLIAIGGHQLLSALAHLTVSFVVALTLFGDMPKRIVLVAITLIQISAIAQLATWWRHRNKVRPRRATEGTMNKLFVWSVWWGSLWGFYSSTVMILAPPDARAPIAVAIVGMAAGGLNMLVSLPAASLAFLLLSVVPPTLVACTSGLPMGGVLGGCLIMAAVLLALSSRRDYLNFIEHIRMRLGIANLADEAETASRAKSRFLANMSHELRTPLNAIIGFAEMIHQQVKGPVEKHYAEFARAIDQSGRHLVDIINDILDLSKIQAGNREMDEAVTSVAAVVERATLVMEPVCANAGLQLDVALEADLPQVYVDSRRLSQVIINLLSNAVKFSSKGKTVRLTASLGAPRDTGGRPVVIQVIDQGIGIPADELQEVLKPFVQSREAQRRQTPGTGLGLPLADQIMSLHGGTLTLASVVNEGTVVTLTLPPERIVATIQSPQVNREVAG